MDPLGYAAGDQNLYRAVGNDPVNGLDPSGLWSWRRTLDSVGSFISTVYMIPNYGKAWETWNPLYLVPGGTLTMNFVNETRDYHQMGAGWFESAIIPIAKNVPIIGSVVRIEEMIQGQSISPYHLNNGTAELDNWDYAGRILAVGLDVLGIGAGACRAIRSPSAPASSLAPNAPKTWQDFLPEAEARLAAAKAKYGDGAVAMAISRKQALNRIEGLINAGHPEKSIEAHIGKLTRPGSGPHIRTELNARLDEIERLATHTGGKTEQEIMKQVQDWRQRISEIPDVPH